jgi:phosphonate transport system substrate-binding protein
MAPSPIRFATFLAPNLFPVYAFLTRYVGDKLGFPTELFVGSSYDQMGQADVGFLCGLAYVELTRRGELAVEPLAAPVLSGARYGGRPVYFSDVVVHRDSPFRSFADLRGRSWAYNEPLSHSGYGITRYRLVQLGETGGYFGALVQAGFHERSLRLVAAGEVDASAIDSQVLAVARRDHPELAARLRVIDHFGPSTIQPVVAARRLPSAFREDLRAVLVDLAADPTAREHLARGLVERFVAVEDAHYDDLRHAQAVCAAAGFLTLR